MNIKNPKTILTIIVIIAAFLRFYQLGQNPPSLTWDEAAWGYNAYSLGIDGRDEHGRFLPLDYLESFGDFKPPLYAYLDIIPIKIFGLNEFAVRFPSAFFGALTVMMTYFLVKELFRRRTKQNPSTNPSATSGSTGSPSRAQSRDSGPSGSGQAPQSNAAGTFDVPRNYAEYLALLSSFFLAISPWHINLSRAAFEANVATFFIVLGVFLFLRSFSRGAASFSLVIAIISFALSMYTFNTARVVTPLLVLILLLGFRREILERKKQAAVALIVGVVVILPLLQFLLTPQAKLRFHEVNIFSDIGIIERTNQEMTNDNNAFWSRILHNRRFAYTAEYLKHYFDHFKPDFLFINGDGNPKFSTQDVGSLYLWDLPFFILGILFLFRQRIGRWWIVPLWMLIGIVPAATARETPHVLRIETTLPTFQIFTAYGVFIFINAISKIPTSPRLRGVGKYLKFFVVVFVFLLLFFNFAYYIHGYYVHYPREYSREWQYGYKESIAFVERQEKNFDEVKITTDLGRPYVYYLFYTKTDPDVFRNKAKIKRDVFGFVNVEKIGKYSFEKDLNPQENKNKKILYLDTKSKIPEDARVLKTFYLLNGKPSLVAYTR